MRQRRVGPRIKPWGLTARSSSARSWVVWPVARRDLGASGESVLRKQSRRTVTSGSEAWTVVAGRATDMAGGDRDELETGGRAARGRDRRAPSALERVSRPKRHRRRVLGAVIPELRSSQLGPRPRVTPACRSTARPRLLNHAHAPSRTPNATDHQALAVRAGAAGVWWLRLRWGRLHGPRSLGAARPASAARMAYPSGR